MNRKMKQAVVFIMVFTLLSGSVISLRGFFVKAAGSDVIPNDETGIPDQALYQMILNVLGKKPNDTFTEEEAQKVLSLEQDVMFVDYSDRNDEDQVVSLQGIEKLTNLRSFRPGRNKITDLKPLEGLKNLENLGLRYSYRISSIDELRNITWLKDLTLPPAVSDLSPIEGMKELTALRAFDSGIRILPDLTGHTKLTGYDTRLQGNNLTKKELTAKLPKQLLADKAWLKQTVDLQKYNVKKMAKTLKLYSPKKVTGITTRTKKITGKTGKDMWVKLCYPDKKFVTSEWIAGTLPNKKGVFKLKKLNLKKYKKKKLAFELYYKNRYYRNDVLIKRFTFCLKK